MRISICTALLLLSAACTKHSQVVLPPLAASNRLRPDYIDLQTGWRLRAIVPLTKDSVASPESVNSADHTITVRAKADFLGYETQYYGVTKRGDGVRIRFTRAQANRNGVITEESRPSVRLFDLPGSARHVRLVYLTRVSRADHNMAVIGAAKLLEIDEMTAKIRLRPDACSWEGKYFCAWIPAGIAVRPERAASAGDEPDWVPVD